MIIPEVESTKAPYLIHEDLKRKIIQYYNEAGSDYGAWSRKFNMHFGFGSIWNIFNREKMLERMNEEVFKRLAITKHTGHIADLGCGVGATMRYGARNFNHVRFTGLTIVPWQIEKGKALNKFDSLHNPVNFKLEDYHASTLPSNQFNGVYAIESACYSPSSLRRRFVSEIYRVLDSGGRFVIVDGFRKKQEQNLPPLVSKIYKGICSNWALPGMMNIHELKKQLIDAGFRNVRSENISWKVAPSILHVPVVILKFILKKKFSGEELSQQSLNNLRGSFEALLLGLFQQYFGYYIVSGEK